MPPPFFDQRKQDLNFILHGMVYWYYCMYTECLINIDLLKCFLKVAVAEYLKSARNFKTPDIMPPPNVSAI